MNPLIQCKTTILPLFIAGVLASFAISPMAQAVVPAPDGGYPGGNTAEGQNALLSRSTGGFNTALGWFSLKSLTTGSFNTGVGAGTLVLNTGDENTAVGAAALLLNTAGTNNTAVGAVALLNNTATGNTAIGSNALLNNTTGAGNTATGLRALENNIDGIRNTANGVFALNHNISGGGNTATGYQALVNNTGDNNTATGNDALVFNTTGFNNTANGNGALGFNTIGLNNTATGYQALVNNITGGGKTAIGSFTLMNSTGFNNTALGIGAGSGITTANSVLAICAAGGNVDGSCFIGRIRGVTTAIPDAIPVVIDSAGQLGTMSSSCRFKNEIKPMDQTSEAILALKPVTFHYKSDNTGTPQFGLIAEEVAQVNPDLVVCDEKGEIYTVRYDAVNAMLLNEFLKEHCTVQEQKATIAQLEKGMKTVIARLEEQASQIQKVTAQIELSKAVGQTALNKP